MLKSTQFLCSSPSTCGCLSLPLRLRKPYSSFPLISRKPIEATVSKSSTTQFLPSHFHEGCLCGALQMSYTYSQSTPEGGSPPSPSTSTANQSTGITKKINFCQSCGGPIKYEIPDGEEKMRAVCTQCGKITYENPKMDTSCWFHGDRGSAAEGAIRETLEEENAEVEVQSPFAQLDIPLIGQTYVIFLAKLKRPHFSPGPESSECQLFAFEDIPFDSLAFSSMLVALKLYLEDKKLGDSSFTMAS